MRILFIAALIGATMSAQAQVTTAGGMAKACAELTRGAAGDSTKQLVCTSSMTAFLVGWRAGVNRGVRVAFMQDAQNLGTTKGIKDVQERTAAVRWIGECITDADIGFEPFIDRFVSYVVARPDLAAVGYDKVLVEMIERTICK
ncbi:hypothetical protein J2W30_003639 [Variovorax boronicumulans]|uniref:hypothetical protein n=1 Tax=Variovorax boronicumulans TaxID=436515 RepID=UPI0027803BB7|nr:hypothetical protein [Variovorax boronicumulans]MDQ0035871.1 hypothetical protein [Variovorax boronicumulans]